MTTLKDRLVSTERLETFAIYMTFTNSGWAQFHINGHTGTLGIESDWGHYSHRWGGNASSWGHPTFTEFLADCNPHYLADKLSYNVIDKTCFDHMATMRSLREEICIERRLDHISAQTARYAYEEVASFCNDAEENADRALNFIQDRQANLWEAVFQPKRGNWFDLLRFGLPPRLIFLRDELLPLFLDYLKTEVTKNREAVALVMSQANMNEYGPGPGKE